MSIASVALGVLFATNGVLTWPWALTVLGLAGVAVSASWLLGWWGRCSVMEPPSAAELVTDVLSELDPYAEVLGGRVLREVDALAAPPVKRRVWSRPRAPDQAIDQLKERAADFAVPASLAAAVGSVQWLTPDAAAMAAVEHATHESISNALDLHATIAQHNPPYRLWSEASLHKWRGHVGEQQVGQQAEAAGHPVEMPGNNNHAGADITIDGQDFQVKFQEDFRDIENIHGDPLIIPEDTANIPADALQVDFSDPLLDPSVLEGQDVIVAEGLTLAGAEGAWESAAGLAAGGVDLGDVADMSTDMLIPGIGSAIRVAASGYRRRGALADPALRSRAMGRVGRDAAYGITGAGMGGVIGGVLGGLVDVATFGLTGGLGVMVGSALGAGAGGMGAGAMARSEDNAAIESASAKAREAVTRYGRRFDELHRETQSQWQEHVTAAESEAAANREQHLQEVEQILQETRDGLVAVLTLTPEVRTALVSQAMAVASRQFPTERSPRAVRRQRRWIQRARLANQPDTPTGDVLALAAAVPGGDVLVRTWAERRAVQRGAVLLSADRAANRLHSSAVNVRCALAKRLRRRQKALQREARAALEPDCRNVEIATDALKEELVICGRL